MIRFRSGLILVTSLLTGCAGMTSVQREPEQLPQLVGPRVTRNTTPLEPAFACMERALRAASPTRLKIGVGQVRDLTGKFSELDGGSAITQGGSLMTISALGKLRGAVRMMERFDTQVGEWELGFLSKRYLGDENQHQVNTNGQMQQVPWKPYMGGTVVESDYYLVGGITELNHAIYSGGTRLELNQIGPSGRVFVANVAVDLRLIDSRTLEIVDTISLQKQVVGYEVKLSVFEFFDDILFDIEAGTKHNEPLQLAVRTTIEQAVLQLIGPLGGIDPRQCLDYQAKNLSLRLSPELPSRRTASAQAPNPSPTEAPTPESADARRPLEWPSGLYRQQPAPTRSPRQIEAGSRPDESPMRPAAVGAVRPAPTRRELGEGAISTPAVPAALPSTLPGGDAEPPPSGAARIPTPLPGPPAVARPTATGEVPGPRGIGAEASRRPRELDASEP